MRTPANHNQLVLIAIFVLGCSALLSLSPVAHRVGAQIANRQLPWKSFSQTQPAIPAQTCVYSINPTSRSFAVGGGIGTVAVNTASGCAWTAVSNDSWLTLTAGASGNGNGTVSYSVAANPDAGPRNGTLTIAGQTFRVFQSGCVSLGAFTRYFETGGGTGSLTVNAAAGCTWTASSSAPWLTLTGTTSGNGNGTITYSVAANTGSPARGATINVSGNLFYVEQRGNGIACATTPIALSQTVSGNLSTSDCVSPTRGIFGTYYADRYTFSGTSGQRIAILQNSTAIDSYVFLIGPDGTILYSDDEGGGAPNSRIPPVTGFYRLPTTSVYTIEATSYFSGETGDYTLSLNTTCVDLSPVSQTFTSNGGSANVTVTGASGCMWTATSNASWLTVNSGSGNGGGTISYSVAPNSTGSPRSAMLAIAGDVFAVSQSSDSLTLSTDDGTFETSIGYGGGTGYYVNRLTPTSYPATLSAVSLYFAAGSIQVGDQLTVLAGINPSGADNLNNVALQAVTATVQALGQFNVFTVPPLTITSGDFVVGFRSPAAFPCWIDRNAPMLRRSYPSNNGVSFRHIEDDNPFLTSNFGLRALLAQPPPSGSGTGLLGEYFNNTDFTELKVTRTDPVVNFDWANHAPESRIDPDTFSVRWTGQVQAIESGSYTFVTRSDDGVRLLVNDQPVIDNFTLHTETEDRSGPVQLVAGQRYNLRLDYFEQGGGAIAKLLWIRPGQSTPEVIPQSRLFPLSVTNPVPTITSLNPSSATAGGAAFTLTVNGSNCINGSVVRWNGSDRATTFVNSTQLTAQIPAGDIVSAGSASITIFNPAPGGGQSNALTFTLNQACTYTIQPTSVSFVAGGGIGGVTVTTPSGCSWTATSNAGWITLTSGATGNGNGTVSFSVAANTGPERTGTMTIAGRTLTVTQEGASNPTPTLTSLNPSAATAGGAAFTLTVNGTNFVGNSVVRWNGQNRPTTFGSSTQLTAQIPASDLATAGTSQVTVFNPAPGGGVSNALSFIINPSCSYTIQPTSQSFNSGGGTGSVTVTTASGCAWTATSNANFITITSGASGNGNGTGNYSVAANTSTSSRTGTLTIAGQTFTVTQGGVTPNPIPTLTGLNPSAVTAGGAAFNLTVNGSNFINGSIVRWNGSDRATTFVGSMQLAAQIPVGDIAAAGTAQVTVFNPPPGGGASISLPFTINMRPTALAIVSAASFTAPMAPEAIAVAFGTGLAAQTVAATTTPLPTDLDGTTVEVNGQRAGLFFVSAGQINFQVPAGTAQGSATVTVRRNGVATSTGNVQIETVAPGLFSANGDGRLVASGYALRVRPDGSQAAEPIAQFEAAQNRVVAVPIDLTISSDQVFLILSGTGLRFRSGLAGVSATIGGVPAEVSFAGAVPSFIGLDQVNLRLPSNLTGRGEVNIVLNVDGRQANTVTVTVAVAIANPLPSLTNLSPNSALAGGPSFTLTVNGTNFVGNSVVRWNGQDRATTFAGSTQLTAQIPAGDIVAAGTAQTTVFNPPPGGGMSNSLPFTINVRPTLTVVSAASYTAPVAADSIAAANGTDLAGTTLNVIDSTGTTRPTQLISVMPTQITFLVPAGTARGNAIVTVLRNGVVVSTGNVQVETVAPGLFSANGDGRGVASGTALRVRSNGSQVTEPIAEFNPTLNRFVPVPIDLSQPGEQVFLILYGTGLRNHSGPAQMTVRIDGEETEVVSVGPRPNFIGMDQINLKPPRNLRERGEVNLVLTTDGRQANVVTVAFR